MTVPGGGVGLPPYPNGWYAVAWSSEISRGDVISRLVAGSEVVVFRTDREVVVMAAHCAHLGAHLGMGGTVVGESIRCPFHGFCFDVEGDCVATGYGTAVPAGLKARTWPVIETDGAVFVWHHGSGSAPEWHLPDFDPDGFGYLAHRTFQLRDHPQETTENSVDLGHFAVVHGYRDVELIRDVAVDGPFLEIGYRAKRPLRPFGGIGPAFETGFEYDIKIHGLGYSQVDVTIPHLGLEARLLVLATPRDGRTIDLRLGLRVRDPKARKGLLRALPAGLVRTGATRFILKGFTDDASQDFPIWENKAYVSPPRLAKGDGPIGMYRKWAKQFYT
ncbi:MAG: Rieske 2Fe-2S domain-containing protein [Acidimicrobiia bacterium]